MKHYLATFISLISITSFSATFECFEGHSKETSNYIFKLEEKPNKSFVYSFQNKGSNVYLSNQNNFEPKATSISLTNDGYTSYQYNPNNLDLQIARQKITANSRVGKFSFYSPKVNGNTYTALNCIEHN